MRWAPPGFGGKRRQPEDIKRAGWQTQRVLVIDANDDRLTWPERELIRQLGEKLYGGKPKRQEARHE
jgi:hypothetical protein